MARIDKLSNFLTDIANSIRNKKGTTEPILASDFDTEINSLSSKYSPRHICFAGYDGTELVDELSKVDFSNITSMKYMFNNCSKLESVDLSNIVVPNINNMFNMFYNCSSLKSVKVNNLNTKNVTSMSGLFSDCTSLEELDLSNFDTSNVINMNRAFYGCKNLKKLNLSGWNTCKVADMTYMICNCNKLERLDIRNFDFSSVGSNGTYQMLTGITKTCLIIVKDSATKTKVQKIASTTHNIKTVDELTDEEM